MSMGRDGHRRQVGLRRDSNSMAAPLFPDEHIQACRCLICAGPLFNFQVQGVNARSRAAIWTPVIGGISNSNAAARNLEIFERSLNVASEGSSEMLDSHSLPRTMAMNCVQFVMRALLNSCPPESTSPLRRLQQRLEKKPALRQVTKQLRSQ